jgi:hypothetical protein
LSIKKQSLFYFIKHIKMTKKDYGSMTVDELAREAKSIEEV